MYRQFIEGEYDEKRKLNNIINNQFFKEFFEDFSEEEGEKIMDIKFLLDMVPYEVIRVSDYELLRLNKDNKTYSFVKNLSGRNKYSWGRLFADSRLEGGEFKETLWIQIENLEEQRKNDRK